MKKYESVPQVFQQDVEIYSIEKFKGDLDRLWLSVVRDLYKDYIHYLILKQKVEELKTKEDPQAKKSLLNKLQISKNLQLNELQAKELQLKKYEQKFHLEKYVGPKNEKTSWTAIPMGS